MKELIAEAAEVIHQSKMTLALTGAGISVESGIPDFRSAGGLWSKYDPEEYATIGAFREKPEKVWQMLRDMDEIVSNAKPNKAHIGLGELESMGLLQCIITQNVDNLHQAGGARNVIEYHGNSSTLSCLQCGRKYSAKDKQGEFPPRCECNAILKPDVVFFGEAIPGIAKRNGAKIIEINKEETHLTHSITDIFIQGGAGEIISALVAEVKRRLGSCGNG
ncbi:MAG: RNA polymerase subunit sigma [Deltaproteobacteria bacterium]|nr:RNA polymerase subunit sigma [Deltaproteobacteria bacterium]